MPESFSVTHGDPTLSNIIIKSGFPILIDPRGHFGDVLIYGDPFYDFAKLYYSACSGYDTINRFQYSLTILRDNEFMLEPFPLSSIFKEANTAFMCRFDKEDLRRIKIIEALIWLSLTGYARDSIETIQCAFLLGLSKLQEILE